MKMSNASPLSALNVTRAPSLRPTQFSCMVLTRSGHSIWEWQPEAFDRAVADFVASLDD